MLFCRLAILKNVAGVTVSGGLGVEDVFARRCVCVRNRPREGHGRAMASSAKAVFFGGLKRRVALFRVAGVALCDIPKYGRRSTLDKSCCGFLVDRIVRAASSGHNVQIPWQGLHFVRCDEN